MSLMKCSECGKDVSTQAATCPNCGAPVVIAPDAPPIDKAAEDRSSKQMKRILLFFAIAVIIFGILESTIGILREPGPPKKYDPGENAYIYAQLFVKDKLKSPSTAEFPFSPDDVWSLGENRYKVISYVDSQNSFGATIRTKYIAVLKYIPGKGSKPGTWELEDLIFN